MREKVLSLALLSLALIPLATPAKMKEVFRWKQVDFTFPSNEERTRTIQAGRFHQDRALPLGLEVYGDRVFITLPRWKTGTPVTLAYVQRPSNINAPPTSPLLSPYPNWQWNQENSGCDAFTSVFRAMADSCGRLWVMDAGKSNVVVNPQQLCPPQVVVFDLKTDTLVKRFRLSDADVKDGSFFTNVAVDVRNDRNGKPICEEAHAYLSDVWRSGLVVYSWKKDKTWRVNHDFFLPDPLNCRYSVGGYTFHWSDGLFTVAMGPVDPDANDRMLYFHAMSSDKEFAVPASTIQNETLANSYPETFKLLGSRGMNGHSSASAMDKNGILFYNLVTRNAVGCWNSQFSYKSPYLGLVDNSTETLVFPNDLKVDQGGLDGFPSSRSGSKRRRQARTQGKQSLWVLSNKLQAFLYGELDKNEYNFRILALPVEDAIKDTPCDPNFVQLPSQLQDEFGCNF